MTQASQAGGRRLSAPTVILAAAGLIAAASAAVALTREDEASAPPPAAQAAPMPGQPIDEANSMIAALAAKLKQDPANAEGWRMLGWSYFELGDLTRSADAYRRAAQLEPGNAENWSSLGEALQTARADVSPEAKAAFERAIEIAPKDPRARYFLAVQKDMSGQHEAAIGDWIALLKDSPPGAPWEADLRRTIERVAERSKIDLAGRLPAASDPSSPTTASPGPTPEQLAAGSLIPPSQQDEMVKAMVSRLADRLNNNPRDADGWIRLMRARMVLGEKAGASEALRSARAAFRGDAGVQGRLDRAAQEFGVPHGG